MHELINEIVMSTRTREIGTIISVDDVRLEVDFGDKRVKYPFPQALAGTLSLKNRVLREKYRNSGADQSFESYKGQYIGVIREEMYCCRTYGYYRGLVAPVTGRTIKKPVLKSASKEELEAAEAERAARRLDLEQELSDLEQKIGDYEELSLTGVQVEFPKYGTGVVTSQTGNKITVQFPAVEKAFVLDEKYSARPSFENDKEIVAAFTEYGRLLDRMKQIKREMDK